MDEKDKQKLDEIHNFILGLQEREKNYITREHCGEHRHYLSKKVERVYWIIGGVVGVASFILLMLRISEML